MGDGSLWPILTAIVLLVFGFLFSMGETALTSISKLTIRQRIVKVIRIHISDDLNKGMVMSFSCNQRYRVLTNLVLVIHTIKLTHL